MLKDIIVSTIKLYKKTISKVLNRGYNGCRFYPPCSDYAIQAIEKKGALRGGLIALGRILRCNPLSDGGVDEFNA